MRERALESLSDRHDAKRLTSSPSSSRDGFDALAGGWSDVRTRHDRVLPRMGGMPAVRTLSSAWKESGAKGFDILLSEHVYVIISYAAAMMETTHRPTHPPTYLPTYLIRVPRPPKYGLRVPTHTKYGYHEGSPTQGIHSHPLTSHSNVPHPHLECLG